MSNTSYLSGDRWELSLWPCPYRNLKKLLNLDVSQNRRFKAIFAQTRQAFSAAEQYQAIGKNDELSGTEVPAKTIFIKYGKLGG